MFLGRLVADFPEVTIFDEGVFYPRTPAATEQAYAVHHAGRSWKQPSDLVKDVFRAEQRLGIAHDELVKMTRRYELARAEIEALRRGAGARSLGLRIRRFFVRRIPRERIRYRLGLLRARALRR